MNSSKIIRTLFLTVIAEVISFGVLIPLAPLLFTEPSSSFFMLPNGMSIQTGYILLGLLIGLYPMGQFLATPILGQLSDIYGRKSVIQLSILGTVISSIIFGIGIILNSITVLFFSRIVNGLTGGLVSVAQATIADITEKGDKSANFGKIGMAFGLGLILGPFLGGLLSSDILTVFSAPLPFFFAAGLSFTTLLYSRHALEETSPMEDKKIDWMKPFTQLKKGYSLPGLQKLFTTNFFYFAGFNFFTTFIPVYLVKNFGFTQFDTGNFFLYIGILLIIGQGIVVPKLFSRFKEENVMPITLFLTGLFIFLQPIPDTLAIFMVVVTMFSFNNSITQIALNTLVSNNASKENQGLALGTNQSVRALGNALPSTLSGIAAALATPAMPLTIAGIIIMATAIGYKILGNEST